MTSLICVFVLMCTMYVFVYWRYGSKSFFFLLNKTARSISKCAQSVDVKCSLHSLFSQRLLCAVKKRLQITQFFQISSWFHAQWLNDFVCAKVWTRSSGESCHHQIKMSCFFEHVTPSQFVLITVAASAWCKNNKSAFLDFMFPFFKMLLMNFEQHSSWGCMSLLPLGVWPYVMIVMNLNNHKDPGSQKHTILWNFFLTKTRL